MKDCDVEFEMEIIDGPIGSTDILVKKRPYGFAKDIMRKKDDQYINVECVIDGTDNDSKMCSLYRLDQISNSDLHTAFLDLADEWNRDRSVPISVYINRSPLRDEFNKAHVWVNHKAIKNTTGCIVFPYHSPNKITRRKVKRPTKFNPVNINGVFVFRSYGMNSCRDLDVDIVIKSTEN